MDNENYTKEPIEKANQGTPGSYGVVDLFHWKSLNRPDWSFSKESFRTLGAIAILVSIILLFFQEWWGIAVTWAALFLFYALTKVPPVEVEHRITTQGITSMGRSYLWAELGPFWFSKKGTDVILHVATRNMFNQLIIIVKNDETETIRDIMAEFIPFVEIVEKSPAEKLQEWFSRKFPLEKVVPKNFKLHNEEPPKTGAPGPN